MPLFAGHQLQLLEDLAAAELDRGRHQLVLLGQGCQQLLAQAAHLLDRACRHGAQLRRLALGGTQPVLHRRQLGGQPLLGRSLTFLRLGLDPGQLALELGRAQPEPLRLLAQRPLRRLVRGHEALQPLHLALRHGEPGIALGDPLLALLGRGHGLGLRLAGLVRPRPRRLEILLQAGDPGLGRGQRLVPLLVGGGGLRLHAGKLVARLEELAP